MRSVAEDLDRLMKKAMVERYTAEEKASIFAMITALHIAISLSPTKTKTSAK